MIFQFAKPGASFKGASAYYLHDKRESEAEQHPSTQERVAWVEMRNLATDDTSIATRIMIATAQDADRLKAEAGIRNTGRKATKPAAAFSLAWHPDEASTLDRTEMLRAADEAIRVVGLEQHQAMIICHTDRDHLHVHILVNRVSPEDGRMAQLGPNQSRALDRWSNEYEKERGNIVTPNRAAKYEREKEAREKHPDADKRAKHVEEAQQRRAQRDKVRQDAIKGSSTPEDAQAAAERVLQHKESPAVILRDLTEAQTRRHAAERDALDRGAKNARNEISSRYAGLIKSQNGLLKAKQKPEWAAHFKQKRLAAAERRRMEKTASGLVALAVIAAREERRLDPDKVVESHSDRRSFAYLVLANIISRKHRENVFAKIADRDRQNLANNLAEQRLQALRPYRTKEAEERRALKEQYQDEKKELARWHATDREQIRDAWVFIKKDNQRGKQERDPVIEHARTPEQVRQQEAKAALERLREGQRGAVPRNNERSNQWDRDR